MAAVDYRMHVFTRQADGTHRCMFCGTGIREYQQAAEKPLCAPSVYEAEVAVEEQSRG